MNGMINSTNRKERTDPDQTEFGELPDPRPPCLLTGAQGIGRRGRLDRLWVEIRSRNLATTFGDLESLECVPECSTIEHDPGQSDEKQESHGELDRGSKERSRIGGTEDWPAYESGRMEMR